MASNPDVSTSADASDTKISDFLKRLEELKTQVADSASKDRTKQLEEEIAEAKRLRIARRQGRSRSVSPEKLSLSTPKSTFEKIQSDSPSSIIAEPATPTPRRHRAARLDITSTPRLSFDQSPILSPSSADRQPELSKLTRSSSNYNTNTIKPVRSESPLGRKISKYESALSSKQSPARPLFPNNQYSSPATKMDEVKKEEFKKSDQGVSAAKLVETISEKEDNADSSKRIQKTSSRLTLAKNQFEEQDLSKNKNDRSAEENRNISSTKYRGRTSDEEEERLSRFLSPKSSSKNSVETNYTPLRPSQSVSISRSPSPTLSPISEGRTHQGITRSASVSPERSPTRLVHSSPFRSSRYSGIGTFASSDFYGGDHPSHMALEKGIPSSPRYGDDDGYYSRSPSPVRAISPTRVGFVQSAMMKASNDGGNATLSKRMSMINLLPVSAKPDRGLNKTPDLEQAVTKVAEPKKLEPSSNTLEKIESRTPVRSPSASKVFRVTPDLRRSPYIENKEQIELDKNFSQSYEQSSYAKPYRQSSSIVSQYSHSNFKPAPGLDTAPMETIGSSRISSVASNVKGENENGSLEWNKENAAIDHGSSADRAEESRPLTPLISRSASSRSPNTKRWSSANNKSSWLESALKKNVESSRQSIAKSPRQLFLLEKD
ncbi:hypothetical protein V1514DRAFT_333432 [Lipomyces japonicus]|uniref:uncharacterized protein n=1 Tax=Lipomyces japonicus TaxID=56871 RepID=UPI0034CD531D